MRLRSLADFSTQIVLRTTSHNPDVHQNKIPALKGLPSANSRPTCDLLDLILPVRNLNNAQYRIKTNFLKDKLKKEPIKNCEKIILRKILLNKIKILVFSAIVLIYSAPIKCFSPTKLLLSIQRLQYQSKKEFLKLSKEKRGEKQKTIKSKLLSPKLSERLGLLKNPFPHYAIQILAPQNNSYSFPRRNGRAGRYKNLSALF